MINRVYMTEERFENELKNGQMKHKTYNDYKKSVDKVYDELDSVNDESIYDEHVAGDDIVDDEINESK